MKILAFYCVLLTSSICFAQSKKFDFTLTDSTVLTKNQIYSATKLFIAQYWKSAQDVVQNDDKEAGIILIKAKTQLYTIHLLAEFNYLYSYTVIFKMKDNKFKVTIQDAYCERAWLTAGREAIKIEPCLGDECKDVRNFHDPAPPLKKILPMMNNLHGKLFETVLQYKSYLNLVNPNDW